MAEFIPVGAFDIVIFGATGDLTVRKLLPALYHRWLDNQIPDVSRIIGSARTKMTQDEFRAFAKSACKAGSKDLWEEQAWTAFAECLDYVTMDATQPDADWAGLSNRLSNAPGRPCVFYLATAPRLYVPICEALGQAGLNRAEARVVLEKPIGTDLASARTINDGVGAVFDESNVYRIDHYLGKETVQNLMVLRFANALFEPVWSRAEVDHVQITVAESLGVGDRADYYDGSGALRDMVQNHLLQLLCLTAMEPPGSMDEGDVRTEKIKVLRALRRFSPGEAQDKTVRAQYTAGVSSGEAVRGYLEELSGDVPSRTETFVAIRAEIENWRWAGVPFYLRTGKRMAERRSEIVIQFKPAPHSIFGEERQSVNRLVIRLQPDEGVRLFVQIKEPGPGGLRIKSLPLDLSYAENFTARYPDAYERLLMDVVRGNLSLFMRRDEVEAAWEWVDGLIGAWATLDDPLDTYSAGSNGPSSADFLLRKNLRSWWEGGHR
ncbi:MAG: glucose-6-phosphate dehydrogenase [Pseudomonadota bacterium]